MHEAARREQILDTAEDLLRRHGIAKTSITDVARALGLSHAAVYKYFATKSALQGAVAERWLHRISAPLAKVAASCHPPEKRLRDWVHTLVRLKAKKVLDDPELFETYHVLAEAAAAAVSGHVAELCRQLRTIIEDGVTSGGFHVRDASKSAAAVLDATIRFHHPHFVAERGGKPSRTAVDAVLDLVIAGLKTPPT